MKIKEYFLNNIIAPFVVGLLLLISTGVFSKINTGDWLRFVGSITVKVWIIIVLVILIWLIIIVYQKRLLKLENEINKLKAASESKKKPKTFNEIKFLNEP